MSAQPRGFAILIILAVIATSSVIIAVQLASAEGQAGSQIRTTESLKARAAAERCVEVADAYVQKFGNSGAQDFDALLDPNNSTFTSPAAADDDVNMPPASLMGGTATTAFIPAGTTNKANKYRVFRIDPTSACFVRFDDNLDDSNLNIEVNTSTEPFEGLLTDNPYRDRDRTIIITSIGAAVVAGVADADLYKKAHALATVKRIRAMPNAIVEGAAIEAGTSVTIDGSICGAVAGVIADSLAAGGGCVCGSVNAQLTSGSQPPPSCPGCTTCAVSTGSNLSPGLRPNPDIVVPNFGSYMSNEGFGLPGSSGNNIGDLSVCKIYGRDDDSPGGAGMPDNVVDFFVWDSTDTNTLNTIQSVLGLSSSTVPVQDCTNYRSDPVEKPCNWTYNASGIPNGVTCGAGQTACWKPIARVDGTARADFDPRAGTTAEHEIGTNRQFAARTNIPNLRLPSTWAALCGGCTGCGAPTATIRINTDTSLMIEDTSPANFPSPVVVVLETTAPDAVTNNNLFPTGAEVLTRLGTDGVERITLLTNGGVKLDADLKWCCSTCGCGNIASVTETTCSPTDPDVIQLALGSEGFAIRAEGNCGLSSSASAVVGTIDCKGTIDGDNDECVVGDLISHQPPPGIFDCSLPGFGTGNAFCGTASAICFKNTANITGDLIAHGNICSKNNMNLAGSIQTESNVGWKNNGVINGNIIAEGQVAAKMNAIITFDGEGAAAASGTPSAMWMEGNW